MTVKDKSIKLAMMPGMDKGIATNPTWVRQFLRMIEAAGVESVWAVEHPIVAEDYEPLYSYSATGKAPFTVDTDMCDPLEWLSFAAGVTEKLKLGTSVLLLPLQSPVVMAKRVATLDVMSAGRVLLGVGIGWQKEEYDVIGVPYEERGPRMDECIDVMRELWTKSPAAYNGKHYKFARIHSNPKPVNPAGVPIIVGGSTDLAARRAGRVGDGFFPHAISPDTFAKRLETMRKAAKEAGRDPDQIELSVTPSAHKAGATLDLGIMKAYAALGVTRFLSSPREAQSNELPVVERYIKRMQDEILAKL